MSRLEEDFERRPSWLTPPTEELKVALPELPEPFQMPGGGYMYDDADPPGLRNPVGPYSAMQMQAYAAECARLAVEAERLAFAEVMHEFCIGKADRDHIIETVAARRGK